MYYCYCTLQSKLNFTYKKHQVSRHHPNPDVSASSLISRTSLLQYKSTTIGLLPHSLLDV